MRYNLTKASKNLSPYFGINLTNGFALGNNSSENTYLFFYDTERSTEDSINGDVKKYGISYSLSFGLNYNRLNVEVRYGYNPKMTRYPTITNGTNFQILFQYEIL